MTDHHIHGDLGDANPGIDPDFSDDHLDPVQLNDLDLPDIPEMEIPF